ncbi:hypothetical protein ABK040_007021 [Willaertia magna]
MQEQHDENHKNNNEQKQQQFNELKVKKSLRRKLTVFPSNDFDNCNNINNLSPSTYSNNNSNNHSPNSNNNPFSTSPLTTATIVTTTPINKIKKKNNEMASYSDDALYRSKSTVTMYNNINNNNNTGSNTGITSNKSNLRHALVTTNSNNNNNNNTLKQQLTPNEMSMSPSSTTSSSSLNNEIKEPFIKVALLGTIGVGKTSLIQRYLTNTFEEMYLSTTSPIISYKTLINLQQNNNLQNNENNVPDTSPSQHKNFYEQQSPVNNNQNSGNNQEILIEVFDTSGIDIQSYQGPTIIPSRILSNNTNNNNYNNNNNSYNNNLLSLSVNKENNNGHLSGTLDLQSVCSVESLDSIDGNDSRLMTSINSGDNMSNVNNTMYDNNIDNIPEILQNELILNCDVFLLVFSLDDYDSYQQCQFIYNALYKLKKKSLKKGIPKLSIILIGNKSDVPNEEKIIESEQVLDDVKTKFIFGSNCEYIETSAKLNLNINNIFNNLYKRKLLQQKRSKSFFLKDTSNIVKKQQFNNNTSKLEIISQKDNDVANDSAKTTKSITNNNNNTANKVHNDKDSNVPLKKTSSMFVPIKARFSTMGRFDLRSEQHDKKKCNIQ